MLLLLSDLTKDSRCIWSCEPIAMLKDYMLQCFLPCHPHHLRYGNAKDQSYIGITTPYGVWQELKMLIQHPLIATTSTSLSTSFFRKSRIQKLAASSPLNLTNMEKFIQTSSHLGRERSFSASSSKKRIIPPTSLCVRGDTLLEIKTGKNYKSHSRLLSCVKVYLGPVDTATLISK
ncbi:hypothetical protein F2Q69_00038426 [Brassica cretica]|uniref:Uncharacterized protein n=1 Tax=Brassica cretica TaxID=69181 RepID=A0A8S9SJ25_BRACR|nr:hypothetical protein F2Q69_00038426 [Brassica cretica]